MAANTDPGTDEILPSEKLGDEFVGKETAGAGVSLGRDAPARSLGRAGESPSGAVRVLRGSVNDGGEPSMPNPKKSPWRRFAVTTGVAALVVAVTSLAAVAIARTLTLQVDKTGKVTNAITHKTRTESIVLNSAGRAVYDLTGDRRGHAECTKANGCFGVWPPVTVSSPKKLSKAASIKGKLGTWHRDGFFQVTLNGHPLYTFSVDHKKGAATGEGLNTFGGFWHVIRPATTKVVSGGTMPSSSTTSTTSSAAPCLYPPC